VRVCACRKPATADRQATQQAALASRIDALETTVARISVNRAAHVLNVGHGSAVIAVCANGNKAADPSVERENC
jgi:hypothetical protein